MLIISSGCQSNYIVGFVEDLEYVSTLDCMYDENDCPESMTCFEFSWYRSYELKGFATLNGIDYADKSAILASHSKRGGEWFVVLEELNTIEKKVCEVQYKVIDGSPVMEYRGAMDYICLEHPIQKYISSPIMAHEKLSSAEEWCYLKEKLGK